MENIVVDEKIDIRIKMVEGDKKRLFFRVNDGELLAYDHDFCGNQLRRVIQTIVDDEVDSIVDGIHGSTIGIDL